MYHEEKVINGILCHRGTPNGEWNQYTAKQLTDKLLEIRLAHRLFDQIKEKKTDRLPDINEILGRKLS